MQTLEIEVVRSRVPEVRSLLAPWSPRLAYTVERGFFIATFHVTGEASYLAAFFDEFRKWEREQDAHDPW